MIRIIKNSADCPRILKVSAVEQTRKDCDSFDSSPRRYLLGKDEIPNKKYYSRSTVKDALMKSHNENKCCYCEQRRRQSELEVEHFRPRTAAKQSKKGRLIYPGYFWLAYDWDNLYLSCGECNGRFKNCFFPLANPKERARSHNDDISNEQPLLVNPGEDYPRDHIRFRLDKAYAFSSSKKGRKTIEVLQLNEENLRKSREEKIGYLKGLLEIIQLSEEEALPAHVNKSKWEKLVENARQNLARAILSNAEFSSMAEDFLSYSGYL